MQFFFTFFKKNIRNFLFSIIPSYNYFYSEGFEETCLACRIVICHDSTGSRTAIRLVSIQSLIHHSDVLAYTEIGTEDEWRNKWISIWMLWRTKVDKLCKLPWKDKASLPQNPNRCVLRRMSFESKCWKVLNVSGFRDGLKQWMVDVECGRIFIATVRSS